MKPITTTVTFFIILFFVFGFTVNRTEIKKEDGIQFFSGTWQQVLDKAKKENKCIFLDAYASWCGPCKMMKNKTFKDKSVGAFYNNNFINVAVDMEKGEGPFLANKYRVEAYPTLIYLYPDGTLMGKAMGFRKSKEFIEIGEHAIKSK
ncbi:MAG: DUF255 domain-containing protein [Bacteroidetes bacterium]|nr:DUF255 domain-containing protein [Bacteroidota bacterium]